ncbi:FAD-dependent oxidoreductase [Pseudonocardia zijingensis]|uniref:FAD-dependent oxidoreductase n=1 Tax=Pseudonocardia zijingensis TaxID=153376 RepID=A0ABN1N7F3_9PSEU
MSEHRDPVEYDVVVLGGNPGGCAAAVTAARAGARVLVLESTATLGGHNANGVFAFDASDPRTLGGVALEIQDIIRKHYADAGVDDPLFARRADQVWESHVNATAWATLTGGTRNLSVITGAVPVGATREGRLVTEIRWQRAANPSGDVDPDDTVVHVVRARIVVDASYEGDLLEWASIPYDIGREARSAAEPHAGILYTSDRDPGPDGVLAHSVLPGSTGAADDTIMAFAARLHCRWYDDPAPDAAHRVPAPPGYDPARFSWKPQGRGPGGEPIWFAGIYVVVGNRVLLNRPVGGNELSGPARDYVLAHPRERGRYRQLFVDHALAFLHFVQTDGGCPQLGLTDDFADNGGIPYRVYVREGRRLVGRDRMTESDVSPYITGDDHRPPLRPDSVAIGDWPLESRACRDGIEPGRTFPEGWLFNRTAQAPYQVPYGCLLPRDVDNVVVCGPVSATHLAAGAVRVESTRIHLGTAAGVAAALATALGVLPVEVPLGRVQRELLRSRVQLTYFGDVGYDHEHFEAVQWAALHGVVPRVDDWLFLPDQPVTWAELAEFTVRCLGLPVSVTGEHFEHVRRRDPAFRWLESLYDFSTRAGVDLFGLRRLGAEQPVPDLLRLYPGPRLLPQRASGQPTATEAVQLLRQVARVLGAVADLPDAAPSGAMSRSQLCALLLAISDAVAEAVPAAGA